MPTTSNHLSLEETNWLSHDDQRIWYDNYQKDGQIKFNQFQLFLEASIYKYLDSFNNNVKSEQTNISLPEDVSNAFTYQQELQIFKSFDMKNDHFLDREEFSSMCRDWVHKTINRRTALVIVDVQNDFIDGSLAIINGPAHQDGADVVPVINNLISEYKFDAVVYTQDWHPIDHISFHDNLHLRKFSRIDDGNKAADTNQQDNYLEKGRLRLKKLSHGVKMFDTVLFDEGKIRQKLWPVHCVQNSWGAELHPDLIEVSDSIKVQKGTLPTIDSYSAFWDNMKLNETNLRKELLNQRITEVYFCGLALDYCVSASTLDSAKSGFMTILIEDACRGLDENDMANCVKNLTENGVVVAQSRDLMAKSSLFTLVKMICYKRAMMTN